MEMVEKSVMNERLEAFAWGLFLVMLGGLWLLPANTAPDDAWLIGAGLIMLGLNLGRYLNEIPMSGFTITLGTVALATGLAGAFDLRFPIIAVAIIAIGLWVMFRPLVHHEPRISKPA
jgi:hypothetical protein